MEKKYDFGWGNPYFLLEILEKKYPTSIGRVDIANMSYAPDIGLPALVDYTKKVIYKTTGIEYQNVFITNGATQAINSILKYYKKTGYETVCTTKYGYPFYQDMINNTGLERYNKLFTPKKYTKHLYLIDSPSNPEGEQASGMYSLNDPVIWDAVYHNNIYTKDLNTYPRHDVMVGSYSKLLGLTGVRIGYVATKCPIIHKILADISLKDIATVSIPSQKLIVDILTKIDLEDFMFLGKTALDCNREQFQKIEYIFDGQPVQEVGMFYCAHADKKAFQLLEKCGINYVTLDESYIRLSLGQKLNLTREAMRVILKEDRI